eukprot:GHVT01072884.1.p1 GENE.GHVT01072884.1~~GHVT01072884.1.p1  ORF type:complete len:346 (+),score=54.58 GHVT01072884.1:212-1249(+)
MSPDEIRFSEFLFEPLVGPGNCSNSPLQCWPCFENTKQEKFFDVSNYCLIVARKLWRMVLVHCDNRGGDLQQMYEAVYPPNSSDIPNCTAHPSYNGPSYERVTQNPTSEFSIPGYSMFGSSSFGNPITESSTTEDPIARLSQAGTYALIGTLVAVVCAVAFGAILLRSVKGKKKNRQRRDRLEEIAMVTQELAPLTTPVSKDLKPQEASTAEDLDAFRKECDRKIIEDLKAFREEYLKEIEDLEMLEKTNWPFEQYTKNVVVLRSERSRSACLERQIGENGQTSKEVKKAPVYKATKKNTTVYQFKPTPTPTPTKKGILKTGLIYVNKNAIKKKKEKEKKKKKTK